MQSKQLIKIKPHSYFLEKYYKKLNEPQAINEAMASLCGGWYLETFKQVINKLSRNKSSPLPLFFPNVEAMEHVSKNKQILRGVFKIFDSRGLNKIDASELYTACLVLSKGSYETFLKTIVDVFGFESPGRISRNQFFFFIDSLYRALPKMIVGQEKLQVNVRLDFKDINRFMQSLFEEGKEIERNDIYEGMMRVAQLNEFLKYIQKRCISAAEHSRCTAIERIKVEAEVRKCLVDLMLEQKNNMKQRQVGFIRTRSAKNISITQQEPSEFSYFKLRGRDRDDEEFSPYRPVEEKQFQPNIKKPPLPQVPKKKALTKASPNHSDKAEQIYEKIKGQIHSYEQGRNNKQIELQQNIGTIRNKIEELDEVLKELKQQKPEGRPTAQTKMKQRKPKFEEESSQSSSEAQQVAIKSIPSPQMHQNIFIQSRRQDSNSRLSSQKKESSVKNHQQKFITFNSRTRDKPIQIEAYSSSSSDIAENEEQEGSQSQTFQDHSQRLREQEMVKMKEIVMTKTSKQKQSINQPHYKQTVVKMGKSDVYQNKGGVCFDVDVKDFLEPVEPRKPSPLRIKKQKVDPRAERLRLRQAAKAYDRMARRAVFSPH